MDPIHPILPTQVTPLPVARAAMTGRVDREHRRDPDAERRRREQHQHPSAEEPAPDDPGPSVGDGHPHIDLTA